MIMMVVIGKIVRIVKIVVIVMMVMMVMMIMIQSFDKLKMVQWDRPRPPKIRHSHLIETLFGHRRQPSFCPRIACGDFRPFFLAILLSAFAHIISNSCRMTIELLQSSSCKGVGGSKDSQVVQPRLVLCINT